VISAAARALLAALALLAAAGAAAAQEWRDVGSIAGGFALSMPGAAVSSPQQYDNGVAGTRWMVAVADDEAYIAEVTGFPAGPGDALPAAQILATAQAGAVGTSLLLRERDIALDSHPGRAFEFRTVEGLIAQVRTYWVRPRLFQLIAITSPAKTALPTAARFFDSFRVFAP
jgi:hypothetical protein